MGIQKSAWWLECTVWQRPSKRTVNISYARDPGVPSISYLL